MEEEEDEKVKTPSPEKLRAESVWIFSFLAPKVHSFCSCYAVKFFPKTFGWWCSQAPTHLFLSTSWILNLCHLLVGEWFMKLIVRILFSQLNNLRKCQNMFWRLGLRLDWIQQTPQGPFFKWQTKNVLLCACLKHFENEVNSHYFQGLANL